MNKFAKNYRVFAILYVNSNQFSRFDFYVKTVYKIIILIF